MAGINIDFTSMSFDEVKESLKTSLREDGIITDFEYEGSNTDTLLNILAYTTTLINHNINYMSNEAFLNTARNRKNILKHAQALNYKVNRKTSASLDGIITFYLAGNRQLTVPKGTAFSTSDGTTFLTQDEYLFTNPSSSTILVTKTITLKEGTLIDYTKDAALNFTYDSSVYNTLLLQYTDIAQEGIEIYVNDGDRIFTETTNIMDDIYALNDRFIAEYDPETEYVRIKFLNKYGIAPSDGDDIKINLVISKGSSGNNYKKVLNITLLDNSTNPNITDTNEVSVSFDVSDSSYSYGGSDEETDEEIIMYAPLAKSTSNRYITASDWKSGLISLPQVSDAYVWGGDEIGTDLDLSMLTPYQQEALQTPGVVYMTAIPSSVEDYFSLKFIEYIKTYLHENSVVALKKKFIQPVTINANLFINVSRDETSNVTQDAITNKIISVSNEFFSEPLNLQFKKSKLINNIYSIDGVDGVDLEGTYFSLKISKSNLYNDSEGYLTVTLPIKNNNSALLLSSVSSNEENLYDLHLSDISGDFKFNLSTDTFLDHIGVQVMNYFNWSSSKTYSQGQYIVYPDQYGNIYVSTQDENLNNQPSGDTSDTVNWLYVEKTSDYMDKYGTPINFNNYKRILLSQKEGTEFVSMISDSFDYYNQNELVWYYNPSTSKVEYYISNQNGNTSNNLSDANFWTQYNIDPSLVAEKEILLGTYMLYENMFKINCTEARRKSVSISEQNTFTLSSDYNILTTKGLATYWNRGDIVSVAGKTYICRFDVDVARYSTSATYNIGDIVTNGTSFYKSVQNSNIGFALTNTSYWTVISSYSSSTTYQIGDYVSYNSKLYICLQDDILNKQPTITKVWKKLHINVNPYTDSTKSLWVEYTNDDKFLIDLFTTGLNSSRSLILDKENLDFSNLKFKRELKTVISNRIITYV